jgi:uncharacterized protein (TIGR03435 family)
MELIIRPSVSQKRAMAMTGGTGKFQLRWCTLRDLLASAHDIPPDRVVGSAAEDATRYDVSLLIPGVDQEDLMGLLPQLLATSLHFKTRRETRSTDAIVLRAHGMPRGIERAASEASTSRVGNGAIEMIGAPISLLAGMIEPLVGKPIVDETHLKGLFDVQLKYDQTRPESIYDALRSAGFEVSRGVRPITFLLADKQ